MTSTPQHVTENLDDTVENYLLEHPDFLKQRPTLLKILEIPHDIEGVSSLIERQVMALREENRALRQGMLEQINIAHDNERLLKATTLLTRRLMEANSLEQFVHNLYEVVMETYALDAAQLFIKASSLETEDVGVLPYEKDQIPARIINRFLQGKPFCGALEPELLDKLCLNHEQYCSLAVVPLGNVDELFGLLAFGSRHNDHFDADQDTLFLEYIAEFVRLLLPIHLPDLV